MFFFFFFFGGGVLKILLFDIYFGVEEAPKLYRKHKTYIRTALDSVKVCSGTHFIFVLLADIKSLEDSVRKKQQHQFGPLFTLVDYVEQKTFVVNIFSIC